MSNSVSRHIQVVIDSRGGGGHIAAGKAQAARWNAQGPDYETHTVDFMGDEMVNSVKFPFIGPLGDYGVDQWNQKQQEGDVKGLIALTKRAWQGDLIFRPIAVRKFAEYLRKFDREPERVVSTQALCIDALAQAIITVNRERGWNMKLDVVMTDMPTEQAQHFFRSLSVVGRNKTLAKMVTLHAPRPILLKSGETEADFWKRHIGNVRVITTGRLPIREAFFEHHCTLHQSARIQMRVNHPHELSILQRGNPVTRLPAAATHVDYDVRPQDRVATIMLGSQPPSEAVNGYIDAFVQAASREEPLYLKERRKAKLHSAQTSTPYQSPPRYYLFVFCGKPESGESRNELLRKVEHRLASYVGRDGKSSIPKNITIVPFTYQDDTTLAPLLHRSNLALTKSGGSTCFELMQLHNDDDHQGLLEEAQRKVFIHSEGLHAGGNKFTDFLWAVWQAIVSFFKWLFRIKDFPDEGETFPDLLSTEDIRSIQGEFRMAAADCGLDPKTFVDPYFDARAMQRDPIPPHRFYVDFDHIARECTDNHTRYFTQRQRVHFIETKTRELMKTAMKHRQPHEPLPQYSDMRKIAIQQLLIEHGIPLWEAGNAETLQHLMGARVASPTYIHHFLHGNFFLTPESVTNRLRAIEHIPGEALFHRAVAGPRRTWTSAEGDASDEYSSSSSDEEEHGRRARSLSPPSRPGFMRPLRRVTSLVQPGRSEPVVVPVSMRPASAVSPDYSSLRGRVSPHHLSTSPSSAQSSPESPPAMPKRRQQAVHHRRYASLPCSVEASRAALRRHVMPGIPASAYA